MKRGYIKSRHNVIGVAKRSFAIMAQSFALLLLSGDGVAKQSFAIERFY